MSFTEYIKEQDTKQKVLLIVFVAILLITGYIIYSSFFKKPVAVTAADNRLKPLRLNFKILESEVFNGLKNN